MRWRRHGAGPHLCVALGHVLPCNDRSRRRYRRDRCQGWNTAVVEMSGFSRMAMVESQRFMPDRRDTDLVLGLARFLDKACSHS